MMNSVIEAMLRYNRTVLTLLLALFGAGVYSWFILPKEAFPNVTFPSIYVSIYQNGISNMRYSISNTAEYGDYKTGPRIITEDTKQAMRDVLKDIQEGRFVKDFMLDNAAGNPELKSHRLIEGEHPIEEVGNKLRGLMPWMKECQLVDKSKN